MAGFLPADARVDLLNHLAGEAAYVGLATAIPTGNDVTLANITEVVTPGYARAAVTWGVAGAADLNTDPVEVSNSADVNFPAVTADMPDAPYAFLTDTQTGHALSAPVLTLGTTATTGGTITGGTYFWVVTALNAKGETVASNEVTTTLLDGETQALSWAAIAGASSYNVYRGIVAGSEDTLVANVTGTSYTDTGAAGTTQSPPGANTAAIGKVLYVWTLAEPVSALAGKPIKAPAGGLVIE